MTDGVLIELMPLEGAKLRELIAEFLVLLTTDGDAHDDALERLAPNPYPDDADAAREYRGSTRGELMERRRAEARTVRDGLSGFADHVDPASGEAVIARVLRIPASDIEPWLRTLAAMRLVIASRLDISAADDHEDADPRFFVYDWLGYRLDELIRLADEHDAMAS